MLQNNIPWNSHNKLPFLKSKKKCGLIWGVKEQPLTLVRPPSELRRVRAPRWAPRWRRRWWRRRGWQGQAPSCPTTTFWKNQKFCLELDLTEEPCRRQAADGRLDRKCFQHKEAWGKREGGCFRAKPMLAPALRPWLKKSGDQSHGRQRPQKKAAATLAMLNLGPYASVARFYRFHSQTAGGHRTVHCEANCWNAKPTVFKKPSQGL